MSPRSASMSQRDGLGEQTETGQPLENLGVPVTCAAPDPAFIAATLALLPYASTLLPEVKPFMDVFKQLLSLGLQGPDREDAIVEGMPASLFHSHAIVLSPAVYRAVQKAMVHSGCSPRTHNSTYRGTPAWPISALS